MAQPALFALALELGLMSRVGQGQATGEHSAVTGGELAGVVNDSGDLGLGDAQLDPPASERRGDRVVVAIDPNERLRRNPDHLATVDVRQPGWAWPHPLALLGETLGRDSASDPPLALLRPDD
jgi:hypothetical protein